MIKINQREQRRSKKGQNTVKFSFCVCRVHSKAHFSLSSAGRSRTTEAALTRALLKREYWRHRNRARLWDFLDFDSLTVKPKNDPVAWGVWGVWVSSSSERPRLPDVSWVRKGRWLVPSSNIHLIMLNYQWTPGNPGRSALLAKHDLFYNSVIHIYYFLSFLRGMNTGSRWNYLWEISPHYPCFSGIANGRKSCSTARCFWGN